VRFGVLLVRRVVVSEVSDLLEITGEESFKSACGFHLMHTGHSRDRSRKSNSPRRIRMQALDGAIASGGTSGFSEAFEQLDELLVTPGASVGRS
jgi:hypothetical protein